MSFKSALEFTITKYCAEPARRGITVEVQRDPRPGLVHLVLTSAGGEEHNGSKSCVVSAAKFGFISIHQTDNDCLIRVLSFFK